MDRSLAGRARLGGIGRSFAGSASSRAGPGRAGARGARARRRSWRLPRIEVPLATPALRFVWSRRGLRWAALALVLAAALLSGGWLGLRHSSLAAVRQVRITGVHGPEAGAIDAALTRAARRMSTLDLHPRALRAAVAPFTVVREVQATASFPHTVRIRVIEQPPVAALEARGTRTAIAADGVVLGPALLSRSLPTVTASTAPAPGRRTGDAGLGEALTVLGAAPAQLAGLLARAYSGPEGVTVAMRNGLTAYFGDASRPHAKWLALALVLGSERATGASYVDVRVPARPAAGFAPGSAPPGALGGSSSSSGGEGMASPQTTPGALAEGLAAAVPEGGARTGASGEAGSASAAREGQGRASESSAGSANSAPEAAAEGGERSGH